MRIVKRVGADYESLDAFASIEDGNLILLIPDESGGYELQMDVSDIKELVAPRDNVVNFASALASKRRGL